jgi:hypothetical protein
MTWREERHLQLVLATDASNYKWGAALELDGESLEMGDFWDAKDERPIHVKEADALVRTLQAIQDKMRNRRVDAYVDNMAVVSVWERQGRRDPVLNRVVKELYQVTYVNNIDLKLVYVPSAANPADAPSRSLSCLDSMLVGAKWELVQRAFGPHSVDLMALDSNVMMSAAGGKLRHFSPFPLPGAAGTNVFAQEVEREENPYVFPPFTLITPLLKFLEVRKVTVCTMVVPLIIPRPVWWPLLSSRVVGSVKLGEKGDRETLIVPSKQGFIQDKVGLRWSLIAVRLQF